MVNAEYAKSIFTDRTVTEVLSYLAIYLKVKLDWRVKVKSKLHLYTYNCQKIKTDLTNKTLAHHKSTYVLLKYQIAVYGIFVERLLHRKW